MSSITPMLLVVLDGWGHSEETRCNAIAAAETPNWDGWWRRRPHTLLACSGRAVGLPDGQMGNSEVGHMHIGAGRVIPQDYTRISDAVADGTLCERPALADALATAAANGATVHILGLLSPGGVHSHEDHLLAAARCAAAAGVRRVRLHAFLDGRDTPPRSARASLERAREALAALPDAAIASIVGRYYAMDRNRNWDRTRQAWELIVDGEAPFHARDPVEALEQAYAREESDEFVRPTAIHDSDSPPTRVEDGDVVLFMNFRADRARQLTEAFILPEFSGFRRRRQPRLGVFVTLTEYHADYGVPVIFPPIALSGTLGEHLSRLGLRQLRIAETEKYAHVTFFLNGGEERVYPGEDRILVPSPEVATYDLKPEMSAPEVTERLCAAIRARTYHAIVCNYANPDMVGHTGDLAATVRAIATLDRCLGQVREACAEAGMEMLITADHGNAEQMCAPGSDAPHTAHTSNPVPLVYLGREATVLGDGGLADIAPTMLTLMGLSVPEEMTGRALIAPAAGHRARIAAGR